MVSRTEYVYYGSFVRGLFPSHRDVSTEAIQNLFLNKAEIDVK